MRRRRRPRRSIESEIPTSSTGDIAFLLIIFFMVTASFAVTKGLTFDLPGGEIPPSPDGRDSILIEIRGDGSIVVDCRPMKPAAILDYLEPKLSRDPTKPVVLYVHEGSRYQDLVRAYESLSLAPKRGLGRPDIQIPTPDDIETYVEMFEVNPFEAHCAG